MQRMTAVSCMNCAAHRSGTYALFVAPLLACHSPASTEVFCPQRSKAQERAGQASHVQQHVWNQRSPGAMESCSRRVVVDCLNGLARYTATIP